MFRSDLALSLTTACCILLALFWIDARPANAQLGESFGGQRQLRNQTQQIIPWQQLNAEAREKISDVVQNPSMYRRCPSCTIAADPDLFRFLVRYPEVVVSIWQIMGVTQMTAERTAPFVLDTDDGAGTISQLELIYGNENLHIYYGTGTYQGPVFRRKMTGRCVIVLRSLYSVDGLGQPKTTNEMDIFLKMDNVGTNLMAKTIQPLVGPTADQNFLDSLQFIQRLNEKTVENGPGVQHMGNRLNIEDNVKEKFIELTGLVYERNMRSQLGAMGGNQVPSPLKSNQDYPIYAPATYAGQDRSTVTPATNFSGGFPTPPAAGRSMGGYAIPDYRPGDR
jgi:hypothetical protein